MSREFLVLIKYFTTFSIDSCLDACNWVVLFDKSGYYSP